MKLFKHSSGISA